MTTGLTVLICTHNRVDLLERAIASLNAAQRPAIPVQILVAANACTDNTVERMRDYQSRCEPGALPLRLIEVPTPNKTQTHNHALPQIETDLVAFVDDDHRGGGGGGGAGARAAGAGPGAGGY